MSLTELAEALSSRDIAGRLADAVYGSPVLRLRVCGKAYKIFIDNNAVVVATDNTLEHTGAQKCRFESGSPHDDAAFQKWYDDNLERLNQVGSRNAALSAWREATYREQKRGK